MPSAKQILATYSPEDIVVVLSNNRFSHVCSGFTEGTFLTLSRPVAFATLSNSADGLNCRVVRDVKNFDVTLTLQQSSETNDILSQLLMLDSASRDGSECFALTIKDNTGRTVFSSPQAFIGTTPDQDFGVEVAARAWVLHAIYLDGHIGGNGIFSPQGLADATDLQYVSDPRWISA